MLHTETVGNLQTSRTPGQTPPQYLYIYVFSECVCATVLIYSVHFNIFNKIKIIKNQIRMK